MPNCTAELWPKSALGRCFSSRYNHLLGAGSLFGRIKAKSTLFAYLSSPFAATFASGSRDCLLLFDRRRLEQKRRCERVFGQVINKRMRAFRTIPLRLDTSGSSLVLCWLLMKPLSGGHLPRPEDIDAT